MIVVPNDNKIWLYGDAMVNVESEYITEDNHGSLHDLFGYMTNMMFERNGIGLAAPQIGIFKRCAVVREITGTSRMYVNPEIIGMYGKELPGPEACMSVPPNSNGCLVPRMQTIIVEYEELDNLGKRVTVELNGMQAVIMQHEVDHLDGGFFFDRVAMSTKRNIIQAFDDWKKENFSHGKANSRQQPSYRG